MAGSASAARQVAPIKGVVVGSQHGVGLVAQPSGAVRAVRGHAAVGMRVSVSGSRIQRLGRAHRATFRGVIVRHTGSLTYLSAAQHMLVVRTGRRLSSARDSTPPAGTVVQTTVGIDDHGDLDEQNEHQVGQAGQAQVQATITSIGTGTVTLSVNGQSLTIPLPAGLTLPASLINTQVTLNLSFANGQVTAHEDDNENEDDDGGNATVGGTSGGTINLGGSSQNTGGSSQSGGDHHGDGGGGGDD
ncbi:MAG TPA: hypothetical protein VLN26_08505 [Gaiellaceae bacterium]|nr:hypothetical protein [Gaiellaceae bacterium]